MPVPSDSEEEKGRIFTQAEYSTISRDNAG
jgi:hypothetical protein